MNRLTIILGILLTGCFAVSASGPLMKPGALASYSTGPPAAHNHESGSLSLMKEDSLPSDYRHQVFAGWDNDMYFGRDYYYSNGFRAGYFSPVLSRSPIALLLIPSGKMYAPGDYHGIQLSQEIFTPKDISLDTISAGDHPYVATLSIKQVRIRNISGSGLRISSEFQAGILGPAALGSLTQEVAHSVGNPSRPPMGWDYQLKNDLILNYNIRTDKSISQQGMPMTGLTGQGRLGTLYTDLEAGAWIMLDRRSGYFRRLGPAGGHGLNLVFRAGATARYVIYDATLQGGIFNKTSPYSIPPSEVKRWVGLLRSTLVLEYCRHQLDCSAHWVSKRFTGAVPHAWTSIIYRYWF